VGVENGSFEYAGPNAGQAAGWTSDAVTQAEVWATFDGFLDDGTPASLGFEDWRDYLDDWHDSFDGSNPAPSDALGADSFETGWSNEPYFVELPETVEVGQFNNPAVVEGFDSFEGGWSNDTYHTDWSTVSVGIPLFSNPGLETFESFEGNWKSNESFFWAFGDTSWTFAQFDTTPEAFEDFEDDWPTEIASTI